MRHVYILLTITLLFISRASLAGNCIYQGSFLSGNVNAGFFLFVQDTQTASCSDSVLVRVKGEFQEAVFVNFTQHITACDFAKTNEITKIYHSSNTDDNVYSQCL